MIKILGVCGSARKASTYYALTEALKEAEKVGDVETTILELRGKKINPCIGCNKCVQDNVNNCLIYKDDMNEIYQRFFDYDAVLIGSPVYCMGITGQLAAFFSRFRPDYLVYKDEPDMSIFFPGAALAVGGTRNGGQEMTINVIHGFYHTQGMPVVNGGMCIYGGASVWSQDKMEEGVKEDLKGMEDVRAVGRRLALTAKAFKNSKDQV
jgi:multimeric flavodoxin WrbA